MKKDWIQTGILIATLLGLALGAWHTSSDSTARMADRFARIEQRLDDHDKSLSDVQATVHRIEERLP